MDAAVMDAAVTDRAVMDAAVMDAANMDSTTFITWPGALALTLGAYLLARAVHRLCRAHVLANPLLLAVALVVALLLWVGVPYARYFEAAAPLHFLLGPATVALAVPMVRHAAEVRSRLVPLLLANAAGVVLATVLALGLAAVLQAAPAVMASIAPKSVTTPVAMEIAQRLGGLPGLTAVIVVVTGIVGYVFGPALLDRAGVRDPAARGIAYGAVAHIMGVARAAQESEQAGAMAGLAMAFNALVLALLMPTLLPLLWSFMGVRHGHG